MLPCRPNLHPEAASAKKAQVDPFPYIDVPQFCYSDWLNGLKGKPIGSGVSPSKKVLIIGAGVSGSCAAYELAKAGVRCTVVDAEGEVGGRCASTRIPGSSMFSPNLVELGAMRFPASESILDHYVTAFNVLKAHGGGGIVDPKRTFPDPGKVPTLFASDGVVQPTTWVEGEPLPEMFDKVHTGWDALATRNVVRKGASPVTLTGMKALGEMLRKGLVDEATKAWQQWIDEFEQQTFYGAMFEIMTGRNGWVIPGGKTPEEDGEPWTFEDFDRFGQIGVGGGGFGSLYPINFPEIMRLIVDGLESTQYFFPPGIRSVPHALMTAAQGQDPDNKVLAPVELHLSTVVAKVLGGKGQFTVKLKTPNAAVEGATFDRVIVATTTRSMECTMNVAAATRATCDGTAGPKIQRLLSDNASNAVRRVHTVASIKVAAQIKKYWKGKPDDFPRCFLSDDILRQIYTLDYGDPDTAICFLTYSWDDDAVRQQGLGASLSNTPTSAHPTSSPSNYATDKRKLYRALHSRLLYLAAQNCDNAAFQAFAEGLYPYDPALPEKDAAQQDYPGEAILYVEWQSVPTYNAAFKLAEPGQDQYVRDEFFDYQKAGTVEDTGLFLAGDTIGWTAGWVEGGLYTALNAAAGVVKSLGGKVTETTPKHKAWVGSPMQINADQYKYFIPGKSAGSNRKAASKRPREE